MPHSWRLECWGSHAVLPEGCNSILANEPPTSSLLRVASYFHLSCGINHIKNDMDKSIALEFSPEVHNAFSNYNIDRMHMRNNCSCYKKEFVIC